MDLKKRFYDCYHSEALRTYFSPGRINIIGEHIDYNGGLVFPAAISIGTYGAVKPRTDQNFRFYSNNFKELGIVTVFLNDLTYKESDGWTNYVKGILKWLIDHHYTFSHGLDVIVDGDMPAASGLSSSASLEVLFGFILNDIFQFGLSRTQIALMGQAVENHYLGLHTGIMDQLIIANGIDGKALLMNTETLEMTPVNATFDGFTWVIINTNYKRKNTDSKYNERVSECQSIIKAIKDVRPLKNLCEILPSELDKLKPLLASEILYRRLKHVVTEQSRVVLAQEKMNQQDALAFGELLNASHTSLQHDYEVTGIHLDTLVEGARLAGAIGARVTGAGFGGCAIALVPNDKMPTFENLVRDYYMHHTQLIPSFYAVHFKSGVMRLE